MKRTSPHAMLDPQFGDAGQAVLPSDLVAVLGLSHQPDGTTLLAGSCPDGLFVSRLLKNGQTDARYGQDGAIRGVVESGHIIVAEAAHALENDRTLVLCSGRSPDIYGVIPLVACYHNDGRLDAGYAENGSRYLYYPDGRGVSNPSAPASGFSALTPSGKLLTTWWYPSHARTVTFRLDEQGQLDTSFNGIGHVVLDPALRNGSASTLLLLASGRILVAGGFNDGSGTTRPFLVRYTDDGTLDADFGQGGIVALDQYPGCQALAWVEQRDGRLIGFGRDASNQCWMVALHPDGRLDPSFVQEKVAEVFQWTSAAMDGDRLVTVGHTANPHDVVVARYLTDGSLDREFADGSGWFRHDLSGTEEQNAPNAIQVTAQGLLIGGFVYRQTIPHGFVARLTDLML
ncbi:delta-60 repeat domain-containing protein [Pseudomonas sp. NPDC090202]|uniref:delta-60 repeat domain-containing protein n=1 Tax=unclassified Pseudomonas TaxID=196821 RepID=UPI003814064F